MLSASYPCAGAELAQALEMNYVFVCEFTELRSTLRSRTAQGGGVHGNAVMTRLNISAVEVISHQHHPIDWAAGQHPFAKCVPTVTVALQNIGHPLCHLVVGGRPKNSGNF
jgi:hypothetical protein